MFFQYNPNFVFPSYDLKNYLDVLEIIVRRARPILIINNGINNTIVFNICTRTGRQV